MCCADIKILKKWFIILAVIFSLCLLCLSSLFFYLVGKHYPCEQWTTKEDTASFTSFYLTIIFLPLVFFFKVKINSLNKSTSTVDGGNVAPHLIELHEIIYPDDDYYNFTALKIEVQRLNSNDLKPKLKASKTQLKNLITNLKNKVNNDTKAIMDLYLQSHAQMIVQNKEDDTFAQAQLTNFENALQNYLTQDELKELRIWQKKTLDLKQRLNNCQEWAENLA